MAAEQMTAEHNLAPRTVWTRDHLPVTRSVTHGNPRIPTVLPSASRIASDVHS